MNKIFLILVLIASSYGLAEKVIRMGAGNTSCSQFLDYAEDKDSLEMTLHGSYAQGVFATMNAISRMGLIDNPELNKTEFAPTIEILRRVLMKHCNEKLTQDFHNAVFITWMNYAQ